MEKPVDTIFLDGKEYLFDPNGTACSYCKFGKAESDEEIRQCFKFYADFCGIFDKFERVKKDENGNMENNKRDAEI